MADTHDLDFLLSVIGNNPKRILEVCCGSGRFLIQSIRCQKHFAPLAQLHGWLHDVEFWQPGWVKTPREEKIERQRKMVSGDKWIIDGNYDSTMEIRYSAADLVIFLDISRVVCAVSAMMRTGKKRSDLPAYLEEPNIWGKEFIEFLKDIWSYPNTGRKTVLSLHDKYPDKAYLHIKTRRAAGKLAKEWKATRQERATHT